MTINQFLNMVYEFIPYLKSPETDDCIRKIILDMKLSNAQIHELLFALMEESIKNYIRYTPRTRDRYLAPTVERILKKVRELYNIDTNDLEFVFYDPNQNKKWHKNALPDARGAGFTGTHISAAQLKHPNPKVGYYIYLNKLTDHDYLLKEIVPHEIAHYVCIKLKINDDHGPNWKRVVLSLGSSGEQHVPGSKLIENSYYKYVIEGKSYYLPEKDFKKITKGVKTKNGIRYYWALDRKINKDTPYQKLQILSISETKKK